MKVAVVGLGYWGSKVVEEYCALRDRGIIDGVVACDIDESVLAEVEADEHVQSFDRAVELADALHICTSNEFHYDLASRALTAGRDVLVEKPLTTDREQAYDLAELASEKGRILQTGHIFRFANVVRELERLYSDGYFGDVYHINLRWTHRIEPIAGTDVLWDLLPHPIDIFNFVTGEWPSADGISGVSKGFRTENAEIANIVFETEDMTTSIEISWIDDVKRRSLEIVGSERCARADCVEQTLEVREDGEWSSREITANNTIQSEAENFIESIKTGENTFNSAIVGARAIDVIEMIHERV